MKEHDQQYWQVLPATAVTATSANIRMQENAQNSSVMKYECLEKI